MKKCPYCAEEIQDEAIKCKHCGSALNVTPDPKIYIEPTTPRVLSPNIILAGEKLYEDSQ